MSDQPKEPANNEPSSAEEKPAAVATVVSEAGSPEEPVLSSAPTGSSSSSNTSFNNSPNSSSKKPATRVSSGGGLSLIAIGISAVALAGSAWLWQQAERQGLALSQAEATLAGAVQRIDSQQQQLHSLQRQLDQSDAALKAEQSSATETIDALQRQLASQQKKLQLLTTTDRQDWLLAEAEYLMRLANQRLLMGKEIDGAEALLKAADKIMVELDDAGLFQVRKALAEDIAALQAAGSFDLEGLYLKLAAAAKQGDGLKLFEMPSLKVAPVEPERPAAGDWRSRLAATWQQTKGYLQQYIQIERHDETYKPLLAPAYEAAVRDNLRLMFEQAQMAALAGKQRLYDDSLAKARHWLENYYTLDKTAAQALIETIGGLQGQRVEVTLPDISGSLRALKTYLDAQHERPGLGAKQAEEGQSSSSPAAAGDNGAESAL